MTSRRCSTSAHHERASACWDMRVWFLFLGPTGLAVGLAQKESRYAGAVGDSPPTQWVPRSPPEGGDSAVLASTIVATKKSPAYARYYGNCGQNVRCRSDGIAGGSNHA